MRQYKTVEETTPAGLDSHLNSKQKEYKRSFRIENLAVLSDATTARYCLTYSFDEAKETLPTHPALREP